MDFYDVLAQVIALLQRQGRVSYRALQRQFALDEAYIEDLKTELIEAQRLAVDENGRVLVWTGEAAATPAPPAASPPTLQPALPEHVTGRKSVALVFSHLKIRVSHVQGRKDPLAHEAGVTAP